MLRFPCQPFVVLLGSRAATVVGIYLSVIYAYLFLLATTLATVFQEVHSFSETESGLVYISLAVGMLIGTLFCQFTLDRVITRSTNRRLNQQEQATAVRSEKRLIPAIPAMVILPTALFI
ncbi:hypothetical protein BDW72DRAFT_198480 [Aspergillus terricola var. indicus]